MGETTVFTEKNDLLQNLEAVRIWSEDDASLTRRTTVIVHGLPLHGWSRSNLEKICSGWGEVSGIEEDICDPDDFSAPKAFIDTASFKFIQDWAVLEIE